MLLLFFALDSIQLTQKRKAIIRGDTLRLMLFRSCRNCETIAEKESGRASVVERMEIHRAVLSYSDHDVDDHRSGFSNGSIHSRKSIDVSLSPWIYLFFAAQGFVTCLVGIR